MPGLQEKAVTAKIGHTAASEKTAAAEQATRAQLRRLNNLCSLPGLLVAVPAVTTARSRRPDCRTGSFRHRPGREGRREQGARHREPDADVPRDFVISLRLKTTCC